jgi:hypothetical protein
MAACPNVKIDSRVIHYLLGTVQYTAVSKHTDCARDEHLYRKKATEENSSVILDLWNSYSTRDLPERTLLLSILLRRSFGGMKSDCKMLLATSRYWFAKETFPRRVFDSLKPVFIERYLEVEEMELTSVDFHCYPNMLSKLHLVYPEFSEEELKEIIWDYRSSYNLRLPPPHILPPRHPIRSWNVIKKEVDKISRNYVYFRQ